MSPGVSSGRGPSPHATRTKTKARADQVQIRVLEQTLPAFTLKVVLKTSIKNTMIVLKLLTFLCSTRLRPGSEAFVSSRQQVQIMSRWSSDPIQNVSSTQSASFQLHRGDAVGFLNLAQDSHYKSTCI